MKYDLCNDNYDVIKENVTIEDIASMSNYAVKTLKDKFTNRKDDYVKVKDMVVKVTSNMERAPLKGMDKFMRDWDKMTIAAELVKTGRGYITTRIIKGEKRKVTVPV